jgi:intergrase/recombinase
MENHQLKWSNAGGTEVFHNITGREHSFESMSQWLKSVYAKLPKVYGNILVFNALTGLRPKETCESIKILNEKGQEGYLNKNTMVLEHFKYPEIFIRRTKKAYISIATDSILELAKQSAACGYNALRLAVKKRGLDMNMAYCRKIFATYLRSNGIEQEIIDLLQGRIPKSVFVRHYFRPDFNHDRIKEAIDSLYDTLVQGQIGACRES